MPEQEVVNKPAVIEPFDEVKTAIRLFKEQNSNLVFDLTSTAGMKEARSHIYSMRKAKGMAKVIHTGLKADILAEGRSIDKQYNEVVETIDGMIEVQFAPIKLIEEAAKKAEADKQAAIAKEKAEKEAAIQAEKDKAAKLEADRIAKEEAEAAEKERLAEVERKRIADDMHRASIEADISLALYAAFGREPHFSTKPADLITVIKEGKIPHVSIKY
jgi:signal transduction histidine kinase